jgi:hypothetical protein
MPLLTRTEGFYRGFGSLPAFLAAPTIIDGRRLNSNGTSIASNTVNPGNGALVIPIVRHRMTSGTDVLHTAPTTTLANMSTRVEAIQRGEVGAAALRVSGWETRASGATGDGTLTGQYNSTTVNNRMIELIRFASGFDATNPIGEVNSNRGNSGTTLSVSFTNPPASTSVGILAYLDNVNGVPGSNPAGWNYLNDPDGNPVEPTSVGSMHVRTLWKRDPGQGPHTFTGLTAAIRVVILIEVLQA